MPRLVIIADTHADHAALDLPDGDLLIHAGDITNFGMVHEVEKFAAWFAEQPHEKKVLIAGNHDFCFQREPEEARRWVEPFIYLEEEAATVAGLRFYGAPWQPWFIGMAFNLQRGEELAAVWAKVPEDTEVLLTHGPPAGVLDSVLSGEEVGCADLRERLAVVRPALHLFGHIHEAAGVETRDGTTFVNAAQARRGATPVVIDVDWGSDGLLVSHVSGGAAVE